MYPVPSNNIIHPCFIQKKQTVKEVATAKSEEIAPNGACQFKCVVYKAEVTVPNDERLYYGISEGYIKPRISKHNTSFNHRQYEHETTLSTYISSLKDSGTPYTIRWSIAAKAKKLKCSATRCDLCLTEKMLIARSDHPGLLNSRSELLNKCRHRNKYLLNELKN